MNSALTLTGVGHDYGDGPVLHDVDLAVASGEVHALLGMNGAGKSTLVHIATGFVQPTKGVIAIDGAPVRFANPARALAQGVALLAQEVDRALVADATVHENLTAGLLRTERQRGFSARRNIARASEILTGYGADLDPIRPVSSLSLYEKQVLTLIRAVAGQARFLFLDEPTSSFDTAETERFYGIVRELQRDGIGIVFISHRLAEITALADRVTVLRGGDAVLSVPIAQAPIARLVEAITGSAPDEEIPSEAPPVPEDPVQGVPLLHAEIDLGRGRKPFPLTIRPGEAVAVFGPLGSGKTTLGRSLFGLRGLQRVDIDGQSRLLRTPEDARKAGLALVPEERRAQALWLDEDVRTHFALGFRGLIRPRREKQHAARVIADYDVQPPDPAQKVRRLSGGNQQKVAIGKWDGFPGRRLLILDEPMKGVDVAAKEAIARSVRGFAASGGAVLYLTQEPDEALRYADRVIVLGRDGVVREGAAADLTPLDLLYTEGTPA